MLKLIHHFKPFSGYCLAVTAILIMIISSIPSIPTLKITAGKSVIRLDYLIHFCEYGFLSFLAFLTFSGSDFKIPSTRYLLISAGLMLFALIDEFHQKFIPGRTFNPKDLISNFFGIAAGLVFCFIIFRRIAGNRTNQ